MTSEIASVSLTPQQFPPATTVGGILFTLLSSAGVAITSLTAPAGPLDTSASATFDVPAGMGYTISAARVDALNNVLGTPTLSAPFDVASTTPVTVTVPSGVVGVAPPVVAAAKLTIDFGNGFSTGQATLRTFGNGLFAQAPEMTLSPANTVHAAGVAWFTTQQDITAFQTTFLFKFPNAQPGSEIAGLSFIVQNSNATSNPASGFGLNAGADANGFEYGAFETVGGNQNPIGKSIAVYFDLGGSGQGCYPVTAKGNYNTMGLAVNGGTDLAQGFVPTNDLNPAGIDLHSGHLFCCTLVYDGTTLTSVLKDTVTGSQFRISWPIDIPACCGGNLAWVGLGAGNVVPTFGQEVDVTAWQFFEGNDPKLAAPTFSVASGQYATTQTVALSGPPGAGIFYTVNGLPPTSASTPYTAPITVSASQYVQAVAIKNGCTDSAVATARYRIGTINQVNLGSGFAVGDGMILNGNAVRNGLGILLTDTLNHGETGTAWYGAPVSIASAFSASFFAQFTNAQANGFCFVLQNQNPHAAAGYNQTFGTGQLHVSGGPTAVGNNQTGMGYGALQAGVGFAGLYSSVALAFDFFTVANSVGLYLNGAVPIGNQTPITGLDITKGNKLSIAVVYNGTTLSLSIMDTVTNAVFSHSWTVDIPGTIGQSSAYVGFTGSTGGATCNMTVDSLTFT